MPDPTDAPAMTLRLHHDGSGRYVRCAARTTGAAGSRGFEIGDEVTIRLRAAVDAPIERVVLRTCPDGEQAFTEMEREPDARDGCAWWQARLTLTEPLMTYRFAVVAAGRLWWLNGMGVGEATPTDSADFRLVAGYASPGWLEGAVVYQIFPDRFANGDPASDVRDGEWSLAGVDARRKRWDEPPGAGLQGLLEFYGGDLAGIEQRLDYLESLGVTALYLTPIFESFSNHGYDAVDYRHVAAHFGGDEALASLRRATAARGIRLILDIAPNHVGAQHPWFRAAQADLGAPTAPFFQFRDHPHEYESWLGHKSLAKLDYRSAALRDEMYRGDESIVRHWLRPPYAIDGWRVDVANMLGRLGPVQLNAEVARGIRETVKAENPDAYLIGENWFDATAQLMGDQWDAVMNYSGFTTPLLRWLSGVGLEGSGQQLLAAPLSTAAFVETLAAFRAAVPWQIARQQLLLLGSHDTARIRTVLSGDAARLRLAFGLLMTYPGVPCIFYGDEVGLTGKGSLEARRPMPWDEAEWDLGTLDLIRALIRLRRTTPALLSGGFEVLEVAADSVVFLRATDEDAVIVVANRGPDARPGGHVEVASAGIADGVEFIEVLTDRGARVVNGSLQLPETPAGVAIWRS